jgi:hypothetical protein
MNQDLDPPIVFDERLYSIPRRFRVAENMHIVFWLFKDMSWAMKFRLLGVAAFIPTLALALLITWQTRKIRSELYHNLAVTFWIIANGYWMICEFFWEDLDYLRYFTAIPFSVGIVFVAYYYWTENLARRKSAKEHSALRRA